MQKNLLQSDALLPVLHATSLSFSRLFAYKCAKNLLSREQMRVYGNVEEALKEGVASALKQTSAYGIYREFSKGCLCKAHTAEAAILGYLAYECALTFKGKQTLSGKDWGEGFKAGFLAAKALYGGPILFADESILQQAYAREIDNLDDLIALFSTFHTPGKESEVFYDFLKASAIGFASPVKPEGSSPFEELSKTRLEVEGYRLSFLLQCLNAKNREFDEASYRRYVESYASSCQIEVQGTRVCVNAHTNLPAPIIAKSQEYGEFVTFSLKSEYMESFDAKPSYLRTKRPETKDRSLVVVAPSKACARLFSDLGAEIVIDASSCGDIRIEELLLGFRKCEVNNVLFLPTSKKEYLLGRIAAKLTQDKNVIVLSCFSLQQAYFGLSDALFEEEGIDALLESINLGIERIEPLSCPKGELEATLGAYPSIDDAEICFVMYGGEKNEELETIAAKMEEDHPYLEIGCLDIGLPEGTYLIGVSK